MVLTDGVCHAADSDAKTKSGQIEPKPLPAWSSVEQLINRHLETTPNYQPGDLITRSMVEPVFEHLRVMDWAVSDQKAILHKVPSDTDFVAKVFSGKKGKSFMRQIANYPEGYDRLYRLSHLRGGRKLVTDLVNGRGGEELIQYLTTTPGGRNMGKMLEETPRGRDFSKPTGRILTAKQFSDRLRKSYREAEEARAKKTSAKDKDDGQKNAA